MAVMLAVLDLDQLSVPAAAVKLLAAIKPPGMRLAIARIKIRLANFVISVILNFLMEFAATARPWLIIPAARRSALSTMLAVLIIPKIIIALIGLLA